MLARTLTLTDLTLFGIASIMGSGGFNLIGTGVRSGGYMWPVALGIATVLLMGSAHSYAGAFERFKDNTSESDMIQSIFGPIASHIGSGSILLYNIASIIVILTFCTKTILPTSSWLCQVSLTIVMMGAMAGVAFLGIDVNKDIIGSMTGFLVAMLVVAAAIGVAGVFTQPIPRLGAPGGFMNSLWMFFFILVGFDVNMKFAEETKDESDIPKSFYLTNGASAILTLCIAAAIALWLPSLTADTEHNAFPMLFARLFGSWIGEPLKWIVLAFILLTSFVVFLSTTRYLYGLGDNVPWLSPLREINAANAPWKAIAAVFGAGSVFALLNNVNLLVMITDVGFAVIAALVAGSVSIADWRDGRLGSAAINGATGAGFLGLLASAVI